MRIDLDEKTKRRNACEAALLLNEITRQLWASSLVLKLMEPWHHQTPTPFWDIGTVRNLLIRGTILDLYRLEEARDHLVVGWLFSEKELRALSFPSLEEFIGGKDKWESLKVLRHQYAGHATASKKTKERPGKIITAERVGKKLREIGVTALEAFLKRVNEELLPGVFRIIDELVRLYPEAEKFIRHDYPLEEEKGRLGR